jgi:hypothetical protein
MTIKLRFRIHLENYAVPEFMRSGVIFNRWLPDGPKDAINVPVRHAANKLQIWFERKGYLDSFIRYDPQRSDVDPTIMARQGKLDGGPLVGETLFTTITKQEATAVKERLVGSEVYIALGKRIVEFLYPPLSSFIAILRTQYGQYWLRELNAWDSRKQSLGDYCRSTLGLVWSEDGEQWDRFAPTELQATIYASKLPGRGYEEYLTKADWERLSNSFDPDESPSLAMVILGRAHEFCDSGELRQSFVEGVTSLEVAISEYVSKNLALKPQMLTSASNILNDSKTGVQEKFTWVAAISGLIPEEAFAKTVEAIRIRNEIIHRGFQPNDTSEKTLRVLLETVKVLLRLDEYKFPVLTNSNMLSAPDKDQKE